MMNDSPRIISNRVEAEFEITRPVAGVRCFLRSQFDRIWQNCEFCGVWHGSGTTIC